MARHLCNHFVDVGFPVDDPLGNSVEWTALPLIAIAISGRRILEPCYQGILGECGAMLGPIYRSGRFARVRVRWPRRSSIPVLEYLRKSLAKLPQNFFTISPLFA